MLRIDAVSDEAQMVHLQTGGDGNTYQVKNDAVSLPVVEHTIAMTFDRSTPEPARRSLLHLRPEPLFDGPLPGSIPLGEIGCVLRSKFG